VTNLCSIRRFFFLNFATALASSLTHLVSFSIGDSFKNDSLGNEQPPHVWSVRRSGPSLGKVIFRCPRLLGSYPVRQTPGRVDSSGSPCGENRANSARTLVAAAMSRASSVNLGGTSSGIRDVEPLRRVRRIPTRELRFPTAWRCGWHRRTGSTSTAISSCFLARVSSLDPRDSIVHRGNTVYPGRIDRSSSGEMHQQSVGAGRSRRWRGLRFRRIPQRWELCKDMDRLQPNDRRDSRWKAPPLSARWAIFLKIVRNSASRRDETKCVKVC